MKEEYKILKLQSIPIYIQNCKDQFVQELIELWNRYNRHGTIYVYKHQVIKGFIMVEQGSDWTIRGTFTGTNYRGQGVAQRLIEEVKKDFLEQCTGFLWVNITNDAEQLYLKTGFNIYGKRTDVEPYMSVGVYSVFDQQTERQRFMDKYTSHLIINT